jgi:hypothetical protein
MNDFELFFLQNAKNKRKAFCPQTTQMNADAEENSSSACQRVLRASLDSVAVGRAGTLRQKEAGKGVGLEFPAKFKVIQSVSKRFKPKKIKIRPLKLP